MCFRQVFARPYVMGGWGVGQEGWRDYIRVADGVYVERFGNFPGGGAEYVTKSRAGRPNT
jgi:hypothetical protein